MEDPDSEDWEIQVYSPSKEEEGETTIVKWILDTGYMIGKNMVITGIVVSSAPLLVPPLVIFSAMGVAFSVPFSIVYASYAGTNQVMSKLLPLPEPPRRLEYYAHEDEEEEGKKGYLLTDLDVDRVEDEKRYSYINEYEYEDEDDELKRQYSIQEEKEEEEEYRIGDVDYYGQEIEALATNVDEKGYHTDEDDEVPPENVVQEEEDDERINDIKQGGDDYSQHVGTSSIAIEDDYENVDEKAYFTGEEDEVRLENVVHEEEDDERIDDIKQGGDDYMQYVGTSIVIEDNYENVDEKEEWVERENMYQEENNEQLDYSNVDDKGYDFKENEGDKEGKDGVMGREERVQMEDIKQGVEMRLGFDVEVAGNENNLEEELITNFGVGVDEQGYEEDVGEYLEGDDESLEEERKSTEEIKVEEEVIEDEDEEEEIVKGSTGLLEKIRDEGRIDNAVENENASNVVFEQVKDMETKESVTIKEIDSQKIVVDAGEEEELVVEMQHVVVLAQGNEQNEFNAREVKEIDLVAREVVVDSVENITKESLESEVKTDDALLRTKKQHLIDSNEDAREIGDESGLDLFDERNTSTSDYTSTNFESHEACDENVDVMALPIFKRAQDDAKVPSKPDTKLQSQGVDSLENEKMWERIGAMRAIVGYRAPRQATCIGELKELYVFTGVEPPESFKGDPSLDEVDANLKFLMAIVGVK